MPKYLAVGYFYLKNEFESGVVITELRRSLVVFSKFGHVLPDEVCPFLLHRFGTLEFCNSLTIAEFFMKKVVCQLKINVVVIKLKFSKCKEWRIMSYLFR